MPVNHPIIRVVVAGSVSPPLFAGLVLCGGRGRRMGRDKALLTIDGERLVDRAVRRLGRVADPVILANGGRPISAPGCISVDDAAPGAGPLAGMVAGMRRSDRPLTAVVAVDMPWFDVELLVQLASAWRDEEALIPVSPRGLEPLHGLYARGALPSLACALDAGRLRVLDVLATMRVRLVDVAAVAGSERAGRFAANLNEPDDFVNLGLSPPGDV